MSEKYDHRTLDGHRQPLGATALPGFLKIASSIGRKRSMAESLREARRFEKAAEGHEDVLEQSRALLAAGQAYLNAGRPEQAVADLEVALPVIEDYKTQGTFYGFTQLASLYHTLGTAYRYAGREEDSDYIQTKATILAVEIETNFGIHTKFLSDGWRLISCAPDVVAETV